MAQQQRTPVEQPIPSHLPSPWPDPQTYNDLYREVNPYQDYSENQGNWQEIRISPGNSAEQVYRRLPVGPGPRARRISDTDQDLVRRRSPSGLGARVKGMHIPEPQDQNPAGLGTGFAVAIQHQLVPHEEMPAARHSGPVQALGLGKDPGHARQSPRTLAVGTRQHGADAAATSRKGRRGLAGRVFADCVAARWSRRTGRQSTVEQDLAADAGNQTGTQSRDLRSRCLRYGMRRPGGRYDRPTPTEESGKLTGTRGSGQRKGRYRDDDPRT